MCGIHVTKRKRCCGVPGCKVAPKAANAVACTSRSPRFQTLIAQLPVPGNRFLFAGARPGFRSIPAGAHDSAHNLPCATAVVGVLRIGAGVVMLFTLVLHARNVESNPGRVSRDRKFPAKARVVVRQCEFKARLLRSVTTENFVRPVSVDGPWRGRTARCRRWLPTREYPSSG